MTDITTVIGQLFEGLFFTEVGSIFGLLFFMLLVVALISYRYELGALTFPIVCYLGFMYFAKLEAQPYFVWHIIIIFMLALFNLLYFAKKLNEQRR